MAFVPAVNVAQVSFHFGLDGQLVENALYVQADVPFSGTDLTDIASASRVWWNANIAPGVSTELALNEIIVRDLTTEASPQIHYTSLLPQTGTQAAEALPNNVAALVNFNSGLPGRAYRGGNYIPGLTNLQATQSTLDPAYVAAYQGAYEAFGTDMDALGFHWVIISRYHVLVRNGPSVPRTTAIITPVLSARTSPILVSQKRRLPGRGV
jgi:hypothetical protein